jgi:uncharacterized membrane protein
MPPNETPTTSPVQTPTTPTNQTSATEDNDTLMGILSYLGPLVIIPLLTAKDRPFVQYHARQGSVLFGLELVLYVVTSMLMFGLMLLPLISLLQLGALIFTILGIVNVVQKRQVPLPIIGGLTKHLPF